MSRTLALAHLDLLLAWRRGVFLAAAVVAAMYVVLLRLLADDLAQTVFPYLVFSDPAAIGFFFVGGIVLADRTEGTTAAILAGPTEPFEVAGVRILGLSVLGVAGGLAVAVGSGVDVGWATFVPGLALTATFYTAFGYAVVMRSRSVNEYFARATAWAIPLFTPLVLFVLDVPEWALALWPTTGSVLLLSGGDAAPVALMVLAAGVVVVGRWAVAELEAARREGRA